MDFYSQGQIQVPPDPFSHAYSSLSTCWDLSQLAGRKRDSHRMNNWTLQSTPPETMTREAPLTHPRNGLVVGSRRHLWPPPAKQMRMSSSLEVGTHCVGITMITTSSPVFAFPGSCWVLIQNKFTLNMIRSAYLRLGHAFPTCSHAMPCQSFHIWNSVECVLGRHFSVGDLPCFLCFQFAAHQG